MSRLTLGAKAALCILAISMLPGCLLTRVMETRTQLCDEKPSRIVVVQRPASGLRVVFEKPTLTDRDVVWIVGFEPSATNVTDGVRETAYEARPLNRPLDRATSLVVKLHFVRVEGEYRLAEVEIPEKFNAIVTPPLLEATIKVVCKAQIGIVPPRTTFDLAPIDRATLPTVDALRQVLGPPTEASSATSAIAYRYCLAPCDAKPALVANLKFAFGNDGELQRTDANYFHYSLAVDLLASVATATVELH